MIDLPRLLYSREAQPGTRLLNGHNVRVCNLLVADAVDGAIKRKHLPVVVGGDCSILLGALVGLSRFGPPSLIHIDGHSDFRHPGNYDSQARLGAVAGMDLALASGRGEPLLTAWPEVQFPLVPERRILQLGERESRDRTWAWPDVRQTDIQLIDVFTATVNGPSWVVAQIDSMLAPNPDDAFWLHFDVDVFDQVFMPAVDSPGSPGLDPSALQHVLHHLIQHPRLGGITITVYDPDLDPDGRYAAHIVTFLSQVFTLGRRSSMRE